MFKSEEGEYLDPIDNVLDNIENILHKIPNKNSNKKQLTDKYKKLRQMYESNISRTQVGYATIDYLSKLELYISRKTYRSAN